MKKFIRRLFIPAGLERDATPRQRKFFIANLYLVGWAYTYYVLKDMVRNDVQGEFGFLDFVGAITGDFRKDFTKPVANADDLQRDWVESLRNDPTTAHLVAAPEKE